MTNREYLNTLSDEEFASQIKHIVMLAMNDTTNAIYQELILEQLQAEHETTADEDFAEIKWHKELEDKDEVNYGMWVGDSKFILVITPKGLMYTVRGNGGYYDHEIDQIRTIAEKKRKEMGWDK